MLSCDDPTAQYSVDYAVSIAERVCDALGRFLPNHAQDMNVRRNERFFDETLRQELDVVASYASFRLFYLVTNRYGLEDDRQRHINLNASLIQNIVDDDSTYDGLSTDQRVAALIAAGLELGYGFVWKNI